MNEFRAFGEVSKVKKQFFQSGAIKTSFSLKMWITKKQFTYLNCETWHTSLVDVMMDGMVIELTNYYPKTQTWVNQQGVRQYSHVIIVQNLKVIQQHTTQPPLDKPSQAANTPIKHFVPPHLENVAQQDPDWFKELEDENGTIDVQKIYNGEQTKNVDEAKTFTPPKPNMMTYDELVKLNASYNHPMETKPPIYASPNSEATQIDPSRIHDELK